MKIEDQEVLHVHNLSVAYGKTPVLWSVDFKLPSGTFVGIVGPNGAGKSTLLKACVGLMKPAQGYVGFFGDKSLASVRSRVAYLPQRESVDWNFPISVREVVAMGLLARHDKVPARDEVAEIDRCLAAVSLGKYADRQISDLSGGQQQRVFIARALAQNADLFFLDEPFAAVDVATEKMISGVLKDLVAQGKTVIAVMHDLFSVFENVDRLILLNNRLVAVGPKSEVFKPEYLQAAYGGQLEMLSKVMHLFAQSGAK
ncbi:MAG TPA: metal ABC transporter ATP-binding protein [Bdellovibrionota bacterium]|jgi:manganese/zinc/iron transport system ATP- binding protein|nr:metal ABC transporter ATP-binding protein [Bdellovibrionota bacterium]